nr:reverse transcriptase domain-containing protein [Tanacetum cinerariifolium]
MADNQTMAELLQAPTKVYEDAIVIPEIAANNFELKHGLINLVQNKQFFRHDKEDPHAHIRYFNKITSMMRVPNVPSSSIKLMILHFSLEGATRIWLEKEAPRPILTWDDLQRFDESFYEAWERFNDLLRACPHHGFSKLYQLDTFYNALNVNDQDSLNSAVIGNFLDKMPRECLKIIESKSKVRQSRAKAVVAKVSTSSSTPAISSEVSNPQLLLHLLLLLRLKQLSRIVSLAVALTHTKIVPLLAETFINTTSKRSGTLPSNTVTNLKEDLKGITTRSGVSYQGPPIPTQSKIVKQRTEPIVPPVSVSIPYPSRRDYERRRDQANEQIEKFYEIFKEMSFEISFTDALLLMPKFASTLKALIGNKEKLSEMARTPMNEHCSAVILNKLPRKLGDPGKFLIPCEFPGMDECLALADLGASINLMPLSVWEALSLPELTLTCMTLKLVDRSISKPIGITKDVSVKVGVFYFPADFVVVDFEPEPRVPLIFRRCFLKTDRALIDVYKGELTLRIKSEAITYNLDQTVRYSANYNQMTANKIDVICEMYSQEVLGFSDVTASGNPTPYDDPIVLTTSPILTPFGDSDFLLFEETDAFLGLQDDPDSPKINPFYYDPEGDILLLEAILNSKPLPPLPNHEQYLPSYKKELKVCEAKTVKTFVDEPPEVELKDLPPHLKYAFLEGDNKLPVIIAKELGGEEKSALIKVLKSLKRAIAWKLSDIQGINLEFYTHKILMEEDYKLTVQHQRRVNPKIHDVIKKEVEKLLDAGLIYPISDSQWVSPMLKRLARNEYYCFLDGFFGYFQIPIDPRDQEKTMFTYPYGTFAYRCMPFDLCNALGTFQRCMLAIFHDMVEKTMEVFMDDFSVFGNSFENCLSRLDKMLQRCEDTNLSLNWEKSHFMVKEGIVLGQKISKNGIEVDKAKVDVIAKLLHPTTVKDVKEKTHGSSNFDCLNWYLPFELMCDASDFAIGAVLGQRHEKHFKLIHYASKTMNDVKSNYTTIEKEMLAVVVTHRLSTAYHPQTSGQVEVSNRGLKRILKRTIGKNHAFWSDKLDDALWAFRTAYKTPIVCTPYKLVYGKACHLPIELEHKAYWAIKQANFDLSVAGDHWKVQLNELNKLHDHAYENSLIYKEKTKRIHDSKIKNRVFNVGDRVLLFNSRFKIFLGKLKTRWGRTFTIAKVFPYGTVELSQANGPNFKANGHRVKHYFGGDVPQLVVPDLQTFPMDN